MMHKSFARKLIRLSTRIPEEDIQNEARVVDAICKNGGHENIVGILNHGWLRGSLNVYFIDMELADLTLTDYIRYLGGSTSSAIDIHAIQSSSPVFIRRDCPFKERIHNIWIIGLHIAKGLEFMHRHKHVHRDLKPSNSTNFQPRTTDVSSVLP